MSGGVGRGRAWLWCGGWVDSRSQASGRLALLEAGRDTVRREGRWRVWGAAQRAMRELLSFCFWFLYKVWGLVVHWDRRDKSRGWRWGGLEREEGEVVIWESKTARQWRAKVVRNLRDLKGNCWERGVSCCELAQWHCWVSPGFARQVLSTRG